jgi:hypothetical protein
MICQVKKAGDCSWITRGKGHVINIIAYSPKGINISNYFYNNIGVILEMKYFISIGGYVDRDSWVPFMELRKSANVE